MGPNRCDRGHDNGRQGGSNGDVCGVYALDPYAGQCPDQYWHDDQAPAYPEQTSDYADQRT